VSESLSSSRERKPGPSRRYRLPRLLKSEKGKETGGSLCGREKRGVKASYAGDDRGRKKRISSPIILLHTRGEKKKETQGRCIYRGGDPVAVASSSHPAREGRNSGGKKKKRRGDVGACLRTSVDHSRKNIKVACCDAGWQEKGKGKGKKTARHERLAYRVLILVAGVDREGRRSPDREAGGGRKIRETPRN